MHKLAILLITVLLGLTFTGKAQSNFWTSPDAYLGQTAPTETPKIFAPGLLSDSGIVLGRVGFSKDGKEFYYGYSRHWFDFNGTGIKQIKFDGKKWSKPVIVIENLSNPALSTDDNKIYYGGSNSDVWQSDRTATGWGTPHLFLDKPYGLYNFQATSSGVFYTGSNGNAGSKQDYSTYDFCTLTISPGDTVIKSHGAPLNTPAFDGDLYVAPDESYMIISANETKTYECELYISFRKPDKTWTVPQSLGPAINDGLAHRFGQYVSPDGKYLFYTKGTGEKDCNFYWVKIDEIVKRLKPKQ
jgi:hypothetical protein